MKRLQEDCYWYYEEQDMGASIPYCNAKKSGHLETCEDCQMYHSKYKPTNADRIRAMTDEELAGWVTSGIESVLARCKGYELSPAFEQEMLDWLRQEAQT